MRASTLSPQSVQHLDILVRSTFVTAAVSMDTYRCVVVRRPGFLSIVVTEELESHGMPAGSTFTFHNPDVYQDEESGDVYVHYYTHSGPNYWVFPAPFIHQVSVLEN